MLLDDLTVSQAHCCQCRIPRLRSHRESNVAPQHGTTVVFQNCTTYHNLGILVRFDTPNSFDRSRF
jgi:hypothetical protein